MPCQVPCLHREAGQTCAGPYCEEKGIFGGYDQASEKCRVDFAIPVSPAHQVATQYDMESEAVAGITPRVRSSCFALRAWHRASANDVEFRTRATRGSACDGLLGVFSRQICDEQRIRFPVRLDQFFGCVFGIGKRIEFGLRDAECLNEIYAAVRRIDSFNCRIAEKCESDFVMPFRC